MKFRIIALFVILMMIASTVTISAEIYHFDTVRTDTAADSADSSQTEVSNDSSLPTASESNSAGFVYPAETLYNRPLMDIGQSGTVNSYDWLFSKFEDYSTLFSLGVNEFELKELDGNYIPQGIDIAEKENWLIVSAYNSDETKRSIITVYDLSTGKKLKTLGLLNKGGSDYCGHAGGVACSDKYLWISVSYAVCSIPLDSIKAAEDGDNISFTDMLKVPVLGSYVNISNGVMWVGEFYHTTAAATDGSHIYTATDETTHSAITLGYKLNNKFTNQICADDYDRSKYIIPNYALSVVDMVQGFTQLPSGEFILSQSYGSTANSTLYFHSNPLSEKAESTFTVEGKTIPLWFLDGNNMTLSVTAMPMSEGIAAHGGKIYVLFESAAKSFGDSVVNPTDCIWSIDAEKYKYHTTKAVAAVPRDDMDDAI
ncbi:MAG: hypothetical protein PUB05_03840 [Firmicutes bacterium]|nr:hypothetical protein [Bacillota bacterium]